jgi:hypothetical protein
VEQQKMDVEEVKEEALKEEKKKHQNQV